MVSYLQAVQSYVTTQASHGAEWVKRLPSFFLNTSAHTKRDQSYTFPILPILLLTLIGVAVTCVALWQFASPATQSDPTKTEPPTRKSDSAQAKSPQQASTFVSSEPSNQVYNIEEYNLMLPKVEQILDSFKQARRQGDLQHENPYSSSSSTRDLVTTNLLQQVEEIAEKIKHTKEQNQNVSELQEQFDQLFEQYAGAETRCCLHDGESSVMSQRK